MSDAPRSDKIWMDGEFVDWDKANVHVLTHTLHYGLGVFEGVRCYKTAKGSAIFRLEDHTSRLFDSAKIIGIDIPFTEADVNEATRETVRINNLEECYIRTLVFLGDDKRGLNCLGSRVRLAIAVWPWGAYLGEEALSKGINVKTSSFARHHPNVMMTKAKVCGAYVNSILAKTEALKAGYDEAMLLDPYGYVAEGSGENIFIVRNGKIKTPPLPSILEGITRDVVITIAKDMNIEVVEVPLSRDEVYIADEAFFTGTAAEITPIRSLDGRTIGNNGIGEVTKKIQSTYFDILRGENDDYAKWLSPVQEALTS
ncbi:Branched-chain amino acid aminotransferase [hydrothermal vent metagenome]|uniref:branched-chain-amino-acid transaminase n=1 Tax=hydrothermal vent metagenome TaxID=652676 RepID=A0A3B1BG64_9ZZZZ